MLLLPLFTSTTSPHLSIWLLQFSSPSFVDLVIDVIVSSISYPYDNTLPFGNISFWIIFELFIYSYNFLLIPNESNSLTTCPKLLNSHSL